MMPVSRRGTVEPLVHTVPATVAGGEVQVVLRLTVGTDGDELGITRLPAARTVQAEVPAPGGQPAAALTRPDLVEVCAELTRSVGDDDLAGAMAVVATFAGCPAVLLRPDRSVLATGEPRSPGRTGTAGPGAHTWRWAANSPRADREITICAGTRQLGVVALQRPIPDRAEPVWRIVHDLLTLALLGRDARSRADAAELQAALFACLSDEHRENPRSARSGQATYRPAVISPAGAGPWSPDMFAHLHQRIGKQLLLAAGLCARVDDRTVCLYAQPADSDPRSHAEAWQQVQEAIAPLRCRVAVGLPATRGPGLQESYRTTRWLADLQAAPTAGIRLDEIAVVDELGVMAGTIGPGWGPRLGHFVQRVLDGLVDNPRFGGEMVDTLHAYLVRGGSPTEAARLLHLSPSTMKYRMRIIRETLGDRLHDHDSVFEIELALRLLKAFEGGGPVSS